MSSANETARPLDKYREVSVQGLPILGKGISGECYRLDDETVLKLYHEGADPAAVEKEKLLAKTAFVQGIPTAISFDIVRCGNRLGVVYELLNASTFSKEIAAHPQNVALYAKQFAELAQTIHSTYGDKSVFPRANRHFADNITANDFLTDQEKDKLMRRVASLPEFDTCIHGDLHTSNVLMQNGEPCMVDMGDFALGDPLLDIAQTYNILGLGATSEDPPRCVRATGIPPELAWRFWELFEGEYFGVSGEAERRVLRESMLFYVLLRMLQYNLVLPFGKEGRETMIRRELLSKVL